MATDVDVIIDLIEHAGEPIRPSVLKSKLQILDYTNWDVSTALIDAINSGRVIVDLDMHFSLPHWKPLERSD